MKKIFSISVDKYVKDKKFCVYWPSSLQNPRSNAVTFLTIANYNNYDVFERVKDCLIFWPQSREVPLSVRDRGHAIVMCSDPHLRFCEFFEENGINNIPIEEDYKLVKGSFIAEGAIIDPSAVIQPGAYISGNTVIGKNVYIGCGVKLVGSVLIGENVVIRENTVIGADGLTTDRNSVGKPVKMPQFGGVIIHDGVTVGANSVIARGAIDDTIIGRDSSIDNCTFISHNAQIGERVFLVGESILFGSVVVGDDAFISGNVTVRNGIHIGAKAIIGMGAVVTKNIDSGVTVKGNPAK